MNPNEINKLKEKVPLPLLILLIMLFVPGIFLNPELDELKSSSSVYDATLKKARIRVKNDAEVQKKIVRINSIRKIMEKVDNAIPFESTLPDLVNKLQQLASENSVLLEDVSYSMQKQFEKLDVAGYRVIMNLTASYASIRGFLEAIENLESPVIINELLLTEGNRYALTIRMLTR